MDTRGSEPKLQWDCPHVPPRSPRTAAILSAYQRWHLSWTRHIRIQAAVLLRATNVNAHEAYRFFPVSYIWSHLAAGLPSLLQVAFCLQF